MSDFASGIEDGLFAQEDVLTYAAVAAGVVFWIILMAILFYWLRKRRKDLLKRKRAKQAARAAEAQAAFQDDFLSPAFQPGMNNFGDANNFGDVSNFGDVNNFGMNPTMGMGPVGGNNPTMGMGPAGGNNPTMGMGPAGGINPTMGVGPAGGIGFGGPGYSGPMADPHGGQAMGFPPQSPPLQMVNNPITNPGFAPTPLSPVAQAEPLKLELRDPYSTSPTALSVASPPAPVQLSAPVYGSGPYGTSPNPGKNVYETFQSLIRNLKDSTSQSSSESSSSSSGQSREKSRKRKRKKRRRS